MSHNIHIFYIVMDCTQQKLRLFLFFFNVEADHLSARSFFFFGHTSGTWDPSSLSRYSTPVEIQPILVEMQVTELPGNSLSSIP